MSDLCDRAAEREAEILSDRLRDQQRRAGLVGRTIDDSALACRDCGEPIPQTRRAAYPGCRRCIDCQQRQERKA
jgi:phage/conjugal plasmid C-4 type zinc finger TraR family protein